MIASSDHGFRHLGDRLIHQGHVWRAVVAGIEAPDGQQFERELIRSPGAVAAVPLLFDPEGIPSVVLLAQYRAAYARELVEIPAGTRDVAGEPAETTAHRELIEECGLAPGRLEHLLDMLPSPGITDSVTTIFLATDCAPAERSLHGPEEEHSRLLHVPLDEALAMIDRGEIADAKSVVGLLLTRDRIGRGDR